MDWMAWTVPTALFFTVIALLIAGFTAWAVRAPPVPRRGFLPMATTRGDRLFLGLLGSAFIHLAWIGLTDASLWGALVLALGFTLVVGRWG